MKNNIGVHVPVILLPKKGTDMLKWSVVACDQYTSQPEYWEKVVDLVGEAPSTLHLTFPEVYLEKEKSIERINNIKAHMLKYIHDDILIAQKPGFIYVDRSTTHTPSRKGLVIAVDLDEYNYAKGSKSLIRATEGTVIERLPPRIKVRENAVVELPHIMVLIDDENKTVIEPLSAMTEKFEKLYDFDLMMDGGHIKGYKVEDEITIEKIIKSLVKLAMQETFNSKYGVTSDEGVLLFAVGDGNHSLASAKAFWENLKQNLSELEQVNHPARFALVEIVNVHDEGLQFEPIHRVVFNVDAKDLLEKMVTYFNNLICDVSYKIFDSLKETNEAAQNLRNNSSCHTITFIADSFSGYFTIKCPKYNLEVASLQAFLDEFILSNKDIKIDYIHGDKVVYELGSKPGNMGFFLPVMNKNDLFKTVILDGALPRKTFSMGEAEEKRFYLESRIIGCSKI